MRKYLSRNLSQPSLLFLLLFLSNTAFCESSNFLKIETENFKIILSEKPTAACDYVVCDNVTDGGQIQGDEVDCPDPIFDPALITNVTLPTGGSGDLEYLWIFTTDDPLSPVATWTPIPNSNTPEYDPDPITVTTYYMRCARRFECVDYAGESNFVTKEIMCCQNVTDGGMIGENQSICGDSLNPDLIENIVSPSGGMGVLEYQWFENTTGVPFDPNSVDWSIIAGATAENYDPTVLYETTYFIRCAKRDSCPDFEAKSNIVTISIFENPQIDSSSFESLNCFASGDGSIKIYASGGTMPYVFTWDNGLPNTSNPTGLAAGDYAVFVTDANGCEAGDTLKFTLTEPDEIITQANWWKQGCNPQTGGGAAVQVLSGGVAPFTFLWNDLNATASDSLKGVGNGTYIVTVTDATGCETTDTVVIVLPDLVTASFATSYPTCYDFADGQSSAITAGGTPPFSYQWDDPLLTRDSILTNIPAGTYILTITDFDGCEVVDSTTLLNPDSITISVTTINGSCDTPLGSASVNATGGSGNYTYEWSPGFQMTQSISDLSNGQIIVLVTDDNGCNATDRATITNMPELQITTAKEDFDCMLGVNGSAWVTAAGGEAPFTYIWNDSNDTRTDTVRNLMSGIYSVTVTDALGCERVATVDVDNISPISLSVSKTDNTCPGDELGSVRATVSGGEMPYNFLWDNPAGSTGNEISNLLAGTYNVTVTDANGCMEFAQAEVLQLSDLSGSFRKTDLRCNGIAEGTAEILATGGVGVLTYSWSNNRTTPLIQSLSATTYTVTVTDENNCEFIDSVMLTEPTAITCESVVFQPVSTFNGLDGIIDIIASGGIAPLTYQWSSGHDTQRVEDLGSGNYVTATIDQNGCECISSAQLTNPSRLAGYAWNDENQDGLQDMSEIGLENVTVTLTGTDNNNNPVNLTTLTDANGNYEFDGINGGDYRLNFGLLTDFNYTLPDVGLNDNIDSDADTLTGNTINIFLNQGAQRHYDVGMFMDDMPNLTIEIGDYVWIDTDRDGNQDGIEAGIPNFRVHLIDAATDQTVEIVSTNFDGEYLFTDVQPGDYYILFDPISLPSDYVFTLKNQTTDNRDSDADIDGTTDVFTVVLGQNDDLTIDAGIHGMCDDVTNGGTIGSDEQLCGAGADLAEITSINPPSGGFGTLEYLWLYSFTAVYNGPGDPNWTMIPNSNSPSYDPTPINATTYYIRCTRREGCSDFLSESNTVKKEIVGSPDAEILNSPRDGCTGDPENFEAKSVGSGATYFWTFSGGATPSTVNGRLANGIVWNSPGVKTATLTVTRFGCSETDQTNLNIVVCRKASGNSNFEIFPNPVVNSLRINKKRNIDVDTKIQLLDVFGAVYIEKVFKTNSFGTELDLGGIAPGIYFVKTGVGTKEEEMTKIIIQK